MKKAWKAMRGSLWFRLLLLLLLTAGVMRALPRFYADTERPEIYAVEVETEPPPEVPPGTVSLRFTGKELLHVNAIYIDGRRVPAAYASGIRYDACRVALDPARLPRGRKIVIRLGKSYPLSFGVISKTNRIEAVIP